MTRVPGSLNVLMLVPIFLNKLDPQNDRLSPSTKDKDPTVLTKTGIKVSIGANLLTIIIKNMDIINKRGGRSFCMAFILYSCLISASLTKKNVLALT